MNRTIGGQQGIPGMGGGIPRQMQQGIPNNMMPNAGNGIPVQQPFVMAGQGNNPMMGNNVDPDMLFKGFLNNQLAGGAGFDWNSYSQSQIKTPLDDIAKQMGGGSTQEDLQYKAQLKTLSFQILMTMTREVNGRQGLTYQRLMNGIEMSKFAYINTPRMQQCPIRTAFINFLTEQRPLISNISKNAAICALAIMGEQAYRDPNVNLQMNTIYGFFEQWVINIAALEMVNWFNHTEQGKIAYRHRTKELEQALDGIDQIVGGCSSLFEWFGLPNPYQNLALQKATSDGTMFAPSVIPSGLESVMKTNHVYTANESKNQQLGSTSISNEEFLRRQREMYAGTNQPSQNRQPPYPSYNQPLVVDSAPKTINGRTDYENLSSSNVSEFDMSFLKEVPFGNQDFKGKVFVTNSEQWNNVKYKLDYAFPNPKKWSGNWLDTDFFYLVVMNENNQWYEQLVNGRGTQWMTSNTLMDPSKILPDLVIDEGGLLTLRQKKVDADYAVNDFSKIFEKDELGIAKIQEEIDFKDSGAIIADQEVMKSPVMNLVSSDLESVADEILPTLQGKRKVVVYSKPVINIDVKQICSKEELISFCNNINFFVHHKEEQEEKTSISGLVKSISACKEEAKRSTPKLYDYIVKQLTMGLNRWLVEKRGYLGLELRDCIDEYEDILKLLQSQGDKTTYNLLSEAKHHKWIFDVFRNLHKEIDPEKIEENPKLTFIKQVVINRVINFPYPDYQKDTIVVKKSVLPELFTAYNHAMELGEKCLQGFFEVVCAFDDGHWWSFTISDIDPNSAVMRRLKRTGTLVDWNLGLSY